MTLSSAQTADSSPVAQCDQLHSIVYAGGTTQPILRIKVKANASGQAVKAMTISMKGTTNLTDVKKLEIYYSGSTPYFCTHTLVASRLAIKTSLSAPVKVTPNMQFIGKATGQGQILGPGDNYFWVVCDASDRARGSNKIDASCTEIQTLSDGKITPSNASPVNSPKIYPYRYRICPYYRSDFHMQWNPGQLTAQHFGLITDFIYFSVSVDTNGNVTGTDNQNLINGITKLKALRGNKLVNLIIGVTPNADTMSGVAADPTKRKKFATQLVDFVKKNDLQGIDIDWEYPKNDTDWYNFALTLSDIREAMAASGTSGVSLSIATAMYYKQASTEVLEQLDFINNMSYDARGEHSTMDLMQNDINTCKNLGVPDYKIVAGLPFYSCEIDQRNWDEQKSYAQIITWFPKINPTQNTFIAPTTKKRHYFNSVDLIGKKAKYVKDNKIGGVMIWSYDHDISLNNPLSLARALSRVLSPQKR
ncbi:MAG: glycosyl hydrolase family 18 protein [Akkermansia sp.]